MTSKHKKISNMFLKHHTKSSNLRGVCVFDLDETLSSPMCKRSQVFNETGKKHYKLRNEAMQIQTPLSQEEEEFCYREATKNAHKLIDACERNNMALAVNTARTQKFFNHPNSNVYPERRIDPSIVARLDKEDVPFCHRINRGVNASDSKLECLEKIRDVFDTKNENVVLIDDNKDNIHAATTHGFSTIPVDTSGLGITSRILTFLNFEDARASSARLVERSGQGQISYIDRTLLE